MGRTCVVTGSASGIGRATTDRLTADGHRVIGVDLRGAEITADLATPAGRRAMVDAVTDASGGTVDVVVANAGVGDDPELCIRVNFFGAVATLEGLRPLLARSSAPRAVALASAAVLIGYDATTVDACLAGDEEAAVAAAVAAGMVAYPSSKRAIARWMRANALADTWAGAGIALNAVGPGIVETPMTAASLANDELRPLLEASVPMPFGGVARPEHVAEVIAFLASPRLERVIGQVLFVDGGADLVHRGDDVW